jgi:hypothetical protein
LRLRGQHAQDHRRHANKEQRRGHIFDPMAGKVALHKGVVPLPGVNGHVKQHRRGHAPQQWRKRDRTQQSVELVHRSIPFYE